MRSIRLHEKPLMLSYQSLPPWLFNACLHFLNPLKEEVAPPPAEKHVYEDPDDSEDSDENAVAPEY